MSAAPVLAFPSRVHITDDNVRRFEARSPMINISLSYVYNYARQIEPLGSLEEKDAKLGDILYQVFSAKNAIEGMHSSVFGPYLVS